MTSHQLVFERYVGLREPGIALPTRAAVELPIDAGFGVPFRGDHHQAAQLARCVVDDDVGAATGHVRCDRDGAGATRLGHDLSLFRLACRVQDSARHAAITEHLPESLR